MAETNTKTEYSVEYIQIGSYKHPLILKRETTLWAINYKPRDVDRFLVTYPKSGTTWTQQIIRLIMNSGVLTTDDQLFFRRFFIEQIGSQLIPNLESDTCTGVGGIQCIKTHLPSPLLPYNPRAKYLWVLRNPKDVCVSYYHYRKHIQSFDDHFDTWISGEMEGGDYFEYVRRYWDRSADNVDKNFTVLLYEQMHRNIRESVLKVADFLGPEYRSALLANGETILDLVVRNSQLDNMKSFHTSNHYMRKGIVGDWRSRLSRAQSHLIDQRVRECWVGTGLDLIWAEDLKW